MNNSSSDILSNLNALSLDIMQLQLPAYIVYLIIGSLDASLSALVVTISVLWKPLHTDTQILAANLAMCDIICGASIAIAAIYHLVYMILGLPETRTQFQCYLVSGIQLFAISSSVFFYMAISIDRFIASVFPLWYSNRSPIYIYVVSVVFWVLPLILFGLSFTDSSNELLIPVCLARASIGDKFYSIYIFSVLILSVTSVLIYVLTLIILKYQL